MNKESVTSPHDRATTKHKKNNPGLRPLYLWHPSLDRDSLPYLRSDTLLVSSANPYGVRSSGIILQEVDRPRVWATILAVPYGFSFYSGLAALVNLAVPGNSLVFTRFRNEALGPLRDKTGRTFNAELVSANAIECYFDEPLVTWDYDNT